MTHVTAELFCDPYAVADWRYRPTLRHVEYRFPEVEWLVRPVVALSDPREGEAAAAYAADAERAATAAGLPVESGAFDAVPASWAACEALVAVREADPEGAFRLYHRLAARAFADGRPLAEADELAGLAARVADVDREAVRDAVGSRRAAATLGTDLEAGRRLVASLDETEVRGDPATLPLEPRALGGGRPAIPEPEPEETEAVEGEDNGEADDPADAAGTDNTEGTADVDDSEDADDEDDATGPRIPAPPLVRLRTRGYTVVVDPSRGYQEFADVLRTFDPDMGEVDYSSQIHGRDAMRQYGISKRAADRMSSEDYRPKVTKVLERLGDAFLPAVVACTDLDEKTCRLTLVRLNGEDRAVRTDAGAWRLAGKGTD